MIEVQVSERPVTITLRRNGRSLIRDMRPVVRRGRIEDQFIQLTEGVIAHEDLEDPLEAITARVEGPPEGPLSVRLALSDGTGASLRIELGADEALFELTADAECLRLGLTWPGHPQARYTGLGARHGLHADQSGRTVQLGADRRYTGPDCPPDMLDVGGIPQGDYAPAPFVLASRHWGAWLETWASGARFELGDTVAITARAAAGPYRLHLFCDRTPLARLRRYLRATGLPAVLPEWAYGHWKSRDVHEHQRDVEDDFDGYRRHALPLDAIVIDSPWETTYNSWEVNPHQFDDFDAMVERFAADGVSVVLWVTPWTNLESPDGQRPPGLDSERLARAPAPNYAEGEAAGHFVRAHDGSAYVARWWMGTGSPIDFTSAAAEAWWREQAKRVLARGVKGIKADDGEGYYYPDEVRFADGRTGANAAWAMQQLYRECMQRALDEVHPGEGVLFARPGWAGAQAVGLTWGGDQASDFWSLRTLVAATLTAAASGYSNWSHDIGGYLGERLVSRCPKELLVRWLQFGCFTPLMQSHGRFEQEAWTYDEETLDLYREYVLLHERLVPYARAAAATAARAGVPIIRPLSLADPDDPRGWSIADAYLYGPSLWVAPVLEAGATEREVELPRGRWIDFWSGAEHEGGGSISVPAPLQRIPVFVRAGAIIPTYPAEHVARGLGHVPEAERALELTVWGTAPGKRSGLNLADGTRVRRRNGGVSTHPARQAFVRVVGGP